MVTGALFTNLFNNLDGMFYRCLYDEHWTMLYISDGCTKLTGYLPSELINNKTISFNDIISIDDRKRVFDDCTKNLKINQQCNNTYRIIDKFGKTKWVKEIANGVYDNNGKLTFIEGFIQDISNEIAMSATSKAYSALQRSISKSSIVSITDLKGKILYVNENFCKHSKYQFNELIGQSHHIVNSGFHDKSFFSNLWETISTGNVYRNEICNKAKDGSIYWCDTVITPVLNDKNKIEQFIAITNLITDKKRSENLLLESDQRFKLAMEGSNDGLWDWDMITNNVYHSPRWLSMIGLENDFKFNKNEDWELFIVEKDRERVKKELADYLSDKTNVYETEFKMRHVNGTLIDVLSRGKVFYNDKGKKIRMIGTHSDITSRKQIQNALLYSEDRLRKIFNSVKDVIYTISHHGKFLDLNKVFENITDYKISEWIGKPYIDIIHPNDVHIAIEAFMKLFNGEIIKTFEVRIRHKSGKYLYSEVTPAALYENNKITSILGIARDITYRKETEIVLNQIYETVTVKTGMSYFSNLTKYCCNFLNVKYACVGIYNSYEQTIQTLSFRSFDAEFDNYTFPVKYTPCELVVNKLKYEFPQRVQELFQKDLELKYLNAQSFIGYPLTDESNNTIGLIAIIDDKPIDDINKIKQLLTLVIPRTSNEIINSVNTKKLQESMEFNKGILSSLSSLIAVVDKNGTILTVNNTWLKYGEQYGVKDFSKINIGANYFEACINAINAGDDNAKKAFKGIQSVLNNEVSSFQMEYSFFVANTERWFLLSVNLYQKDDPKAVIRHIDITQRKLSENKLQTSEKKYRELIENSLDLIFSSDLSGNINFANKKFIKTLKFNQLETNKLNIKDILRGNSDNNVEYIYFKKNKKSQPKKFEGEILGKNKTKIAVVGTIIPLLENGKIIGNQSFFKDISSNKKTELELLRSEQRYKNVVENINDAIIVKNIKGKIIYANDKFYELIGLKDKPLNKLKLNDYITPEWIGTMELKYKQILNKNKQFDTIEYLGKNISGQKIWLEDKITLVNEGNTTIGTLTVIRNINDLKIKEIELNRLIKELTNRNNEMLQFNYIVSHNLRAPIANIIGLCSLISDVKGNDSENKKMLDLIKLSTDKLDGIIKDLNIILNIKNTLNLKRENIKISKALFNIYESFQKEIHEISGDIKINIDKQANELYTIKSYIESIFYNLFSNSIKYRSQERQLRIVITSKKVADKYIVHFEDNGIGIDLSEHGQYVFGLYKRFNYEVEGKGLGLHMVKNQVEAINGKINIESELGKGTKFIIELPSDNTERKPIDIKPT
ncbi:MAG: PAS domain S-box protein [Sphingobacteriaceae bacterium]